MIHTILFIISIVVDFFSLRRCKDDFNRVYCVFIETESTSVNVGRLTGAISICVNDSHGLHHIKISFQQL